MKLVLEEYIITFVGEKVAGSPMIDHTQYFHFRLVWLESVQISQKSTWNLTVQVSADFEWNSAKICGLRITVYLVNVNSLGGKLVSSLNDVLQVAVSLLSFGPALALKHAMVCRSYIR
jgi:hypothetical protein